MYIHNTILCLSRLMREKYVMRMADCQDRHVFVFANLFNFPIFSYSILCIVFTVNTVELQLTTTEKLFQKCRF